MIELRNVTKEYSKGMQLERSIRERLNRESSYSS